VTRSADDASAPMSSTYYAPGKVVISGAYSVLHGAPALVAAVDRYASATTARAAEFVTEEWRAALPGVAAPWFDAAELRHKGRKLGLGSSSAILVACLAAHFDRCDREFVDRELFPRALQAHRQAQSGGSGIDVAAACYGGCLCARRAGDRLLLEPVTLPELVVEVWASQASASTSEFLARVRLLERDYSHRHQALMVDLGQAAEAARAATIRARPEELLAALGRQFRGFRALGQAAGIPIVTPEVDALNRLAAEQGSVVLPSGAGGGDVALYLGPTPPGPALLDALEQSTHQRLPVSLNGRGVHRG